ncbi:MAG: branched-chain amino acid ABC transporter permease [Armatimonadota bacterium]|nr:branched-chain amino acid ABC transporter permease [Armatimonadota bacterium]
MVWVEIVLGGLLLGGLYALLSVGLNLQYGLMRVLNVAHGEFVVLGGYVTYTLVVGWKVNPLATLAVTGPGLFLVGLAVHRVLFRGLVRLRRTREELEANSMLLCFGLLFVLQNAMLLLWRADIRGYTYWDHPWTLAGVAMPANRVVAFAAAVGLTGGLFAALRYTLVGTALRALMQDAVGARVVGIPVQKAHALCFALGVALAGVTGSLLSMLYPLTPFAGFPYTVTGLVVVILGGLGSLVGSLIGGLLLGVVEAVGVYLTSPDLRLALSYGVLVTTLVVRPYGLVNAAARRPGQQPWV